MGPQTVPRCPTTLLLFAVKYEPTPERWEKKPSLCPPTARGVRADGEGTAARCWSARVRCLFLERGKCEVSVPLGLFVLVHTGKRRQEGFGATQFELLG